MPLLIALGDGIAPPRFDLESAFMELPEPSIYFMEFIFVLGALD